MGFNIDIISSGSKGNCVLIDDCILIDVGLTFKKLQFELTERGKSMDTVDRIFVTHKHSDHVNIPLLNKVSQTHPWLISRGLHVNQDTLNKIDEYAERSPKFNFEFDGGNLLRSDDDFNIDTRNGTYRVVTFKLPHGDVENQGFIFINESGESLLYATDTETMEYAPNHVVDYVYDYILLEGNYDDDVLEQALMSDDSTIFHRALRNLRHLPESEFKRFAVRYSHNDTKIYRLHESEEYGIRHELAAMSVGDLDK